MLILATPSALATTSIFSGTIAASDATQTGRLIRSDPASTCAAEQSGSAFDSTQYHYDSYSLQNGTAASQCITATLDPQQNCTGGLQSAAYTPAFDPANIASNLLGDLGLSPSAPKSYSFNVTAAANFDVTVNEVPANVGCEGYGLTVSGPGAIYTKATFPNGGSIDGREPTQMGRWNYHTKPTCTAPQAAIPTATGSSFHYDKYRFQNTAPFAECATITLDGFTCDPSANFFKNVQSAVYSPAFNPANITQNLLSDQGAGIQSSQETYSVTVPAAAGFNVTVNETANLQPGCDAYSLTVSGFGIQPAAPTVATLLGFSAARVAHGVVLRWRTASELTSLGYNVYRERAGKRTRLNSKLIPAARLGELHIYSWVDHSASQRPARYWLQEVRLDSSRVWAGKANAARGE